MGSGGFGAVRRTTPDVVAKLEEKKCPDIRLISSVNLDSFTFLCLSFLCGNTLKKFYLQEL